MNSIQFIERDGEPEYAVVPIKLFDRMREALDAAEDIAELERFRASDDDFRIPGAVADAILDGASPVKAWREHLKLTQDVLAAQHVSRHCGAGQPAFRYSSVSLLLVMQTNFGVLGILPNFRQSKMAHIYRRTKPAKDIAKRTLSPGYFDEAHRLLCGPWRLTSAARS